MKEIKKTELRGITGQVGRPLWLAMNEQWLNRLHLLFVLLFCLVMSGLTAVPGCSIGLQCKGVLHRAQMMWFSLGLRRWDSTGFLMYGLPR